jgi:hypothetical protein
MAGCWQLFPERKASLNIAGHVLVDGRLLAIISREESKFKE